MYLEVLHPLCLTEMNYHTNVRYCYSKQTRLLPGRLAAPPHPRPHCIMHTVDCLMAQSSKQSKNRHYTDKLSHFCLSCLLNRLLFFWPDLNVCLTFSFFFFPGKRRILFSQNNTILKMELRWMDFAFGLFWTCTLWYGYYGQYVWERLLHSSQMMDVCPWRVNPVISFHVITVCIETTPSIPKRKKKIKLITF